MIIGHSISSADGIIRAIDEPVARMLRRTQKELIGTCYTAITHPEDLARNVSEVKALQPNGQSRSIRKRYVCGDGSVILLDVRVLRLGGDDAGHLVGTMSTVAAQASIVSDPGADEHPPHRLWRRAKDLLAIMQARDQTLGGDLFADHAWALLLSVYVAEAESRIATADSIAEQIGLNAATLGRWIRVLESKSLLDPPADVHNGLQLTQTGIANVERLLSIRSLADVS